MVPNRAADRRRGAVRLQRVVVGPLLDEHERPVGLVQGVQLAARLFVHRFDGLLAGVAHGVDGFGLGGQVATTTTGMGWMTAR